MKTNRIFRWLLKALALTIVMVVMQSCVDSLFENRMRGSSNNKEDVEEPSASEDLHFSGFGHDDGNYGDDYIP